MNDPWSDQTEPDGVPDGEADPAVTAALASMAPPSHGYGFWATVEARLPPGPAAGALPPATAGEPPRTPGAPPPTEPPYPPLSAGEPGLAELSPAPRRGPAGWWVAAAVAAGLVVVAAAAAIIIRPGSTAVATRPVAADVPQTSTTFVIPLVTTVPSVTTTTTAAAPSTTTVFPVSPPRTTAPTTAPARTTTTARLASLTLSPDGLGPLHLGMTPQEATATGAVGPFQPSEINPASGCGSASPASAYQSGDFSTLFLNGRLARIYVSAGSRLRTPQGIVVGTALSRLATVPGTRTESPEPYGAGTNVDILTGDTGYQFTVENGVVTTWSVGTKAGLDTPEGCA